MNFFKKFGVFLYDRFSGRNAKNFKADERIFTRANILTFSGILAIGFYVFQFMAGFFVGWIPATKLYVLATDMFDGVLADRYNEHSRFGKILDPLRDRLDVAAILLNMWILFGSEITVLFYAVTIEAVIMLQWSWSYLLQKKVKEVHWIGKARMAVHQVCAFIVLVQAYWLGHFYINAEVLVAIMASASFAALVGYKFPSHW